MEVESVLSQSVDGGDLCPWGDSNVPDFNFSLFFFEIRIFLKSVHFQLIFSGFHGFQSGGKR
jgi:hypothetical protein